MASYVYVKSPDNENLWVLGELVATTKTNADVKFFNEVNSVDLSLYPNSELPRANVDPATSKLLIYPDLAKVPFLHEPGILFNLKERNRLGEPYSFCGGELVVAVNPYEWLNHKYTENIQKMYSNVLRDSIIGFEPHVYYTSSLCYQSLVKTGRNQSILVSGESGAGKTETVKILLRHVAYLSEMSSSTTTTTTNTNTNTNTNTTTNNNNIVKKIVDTNPLLEAFGNAKTVRNDNSSRFGKFIRLQFSSSQLVGSSCSTYLLEKSRVVSHSENERSFHIFYELLAASPIPFLSDHQDFNYLSSNIENEMAETIEGETNTERWAKTKNALALIDIAGEQLTTLVRALVTVLQLGNITFAEHDKNADASVVVGDGQLQNLTKIFGLDEEKLRQALTFRTLTTKGESFEVPLSMVDASSNRDAFAKELYARIFDWLVSEINANTSNVAAAELGWVGLLDIFGFESFKINRFEQLCINYTNEKIQQKFTLDIFASVVAEYASEGIPLDNIEYSDNASVLGLIEGRMGVINVLNEECVRPKGSDESFVFKLYATNNDDAEDSDLIQNKRFGKLDFGIKHYAGDVVYTGEEFVSKNKDSLPKSMVTISAKCSNTLISTVMGKSSSRSLQSSSKQRRGSGMNNNLVWSKFKSQLGGLMEALSTTETRYVRCIKPNMEKLPKVVDDESVIEQLRCAGVIAAVNVSRSTFPNRMLHEAVVEKFACCCDRETDVFNVKLILSKLLDQTAFEVGKTRIYFRKGMLEKLENIRLKKLGASAVKICAFFMMVVGRSVYRRILCQIVMMQTLGRRGVRRLEFKRLREAVVIVQGMARVKAAKELARGLKRGKAANVIVRNFGGRIKRCEARETFLKMKREVVVIQTMARRVAQQGKFKNLLHEHKEALKMENQVIMLQKKLEAKDAEMKEMAKSGGGEGSVSHSPGGGALMVESEHMLQYLRDENAKLKKANGALFGENNELKATNRRLEDANAGAGASFAALNQHAKQLTKMNMKITNEKESLHKKIHTVSLKSAEYREEMKMKHLVYMTEVQNRLIYQQTVNEVVEKICRRKGDAKYEKLKDSVKLLRDRANEKFNNGADAMDADLQSVKTPKRKKKEERTPDSRSSNDSIGSGSGSRIFLNNSAANSAFKENSKNSRNNFARGEGLYDNFANDKEKLSPEKRKSKSKSKSVERKVEGVQEDLKALGNVFSRIFGK